jgi:hypothetical protein
LSGEVATLVKLSRVLLLGPAVVLIGLAFRVWGGEAERRVDEVVHLRAVVRGDLLEVWRRCEAFDLMPMALVDPAKQVTAC